MPTVRFEGREIACAPGSTLRSVLLEAGTTPHNCSARWLNCKGFGTCGTCAVRVEGHVDEPSMRERARLAFPPHRPDAGLRLACQVKVNDDLVVTKHAGFWGQETEQVREPGGEEGA